MNTQLEIDNELLNKAKQILHTTNDSDTVHKALLQVVRQSNKEILSSYFGKLDLNADMDTIRGRNRITGEN